MSLFAAILARSPRAICQACGITRPHHSSRPLPMADASQLILNCAHSYIEQRTNATLRALHRACRIWLASHALSIARANAPKTRTSTAASPEPFGGRLLPNSKSHGSIDLHPVISGNPANMVQANESAYLTECRDAKRHLNQSLKLARNDTAKQLAHHWHDSKINEARERYEIQPERHYSGTEQAELFDAIDQRASQTASVTLASAYQRHVIEAERVNRVSAAHAQWLAVRMPRQPATERQPVSPRTVRICSL